MDRRSFLKFGALTGLALIIPSNLIIDHKDEETKWIEHLLTTYSDEVFVIGCIKEYVYQFRIVNKQDITQAFTELIKRQPFLISWLRERINKYDKTSRYYQNKVKPSWSLIIMTSKEYNLAAKKLNTPPISQHKLDLYETWAKYETKYIIHEGSCV